MSQADAARGADLPPAPPAAGALRIATFNAALARQGAGILIRDLERGDPQAEAVAEIILHVRPDVLVINELDADPAGRSLDLFRALLARGVAGLPGLDYGHAFQGAQNVGVFSERDLDGDGEAAGPDDAWGYGRFPGQYAMAVLSRLPLEQTSVRSFTDLRWAAMPGARRPQLPDGTPFHPDEVWAELRLSSKSHWIVPIALPAGGRLDLVVAHPTPPVFDGPEDRNGRRNADEIRLIRDLIDGASWPIDDAGVAGGLDRGARFVIAGDLNADPHGGDGIRAEIGALLSHPGVRDPAPVSPGAAEAARQSRPEPDAVGADPARHTADWPDGPGRPGNLRVDYVLASADLEVTGAGVFWPAASDPLARLVGQRGRSLASSDHRLVWIDIRP